MDIGSAVGRARGVRPEQIESLGDYATSPAFDARERAVLDYATAMTLTPARVDAACFTAVRGHFDDEQIIELTAAIAWESFRSRFNRALEIPSDGFAEAHVCAIPARAPEALRAAASD